MQNPPSNDPTPSRQDAIQAEAIEDVRRRVREQKLRDEAQATLDAARRPRWRRGAGRSPWEIGAGNPNGFLFALIGANWLMPLIPLAIWLVISSVLWLATNLRLPIYLILRALDIATGARALAGAPWLMWTLWGGIFGGALGYWLVAPVYGNRENRAFLLLLPLLAMVLSGGLLWAFVR